jgi:cysteinyl-tRNA synthetase
VADILRRYLEYRGYEVNHVMNITDLDDKTIQASEKAGMDVKLFADKYVQASMEDMAALGIKPATRYARASEHIDDMVALTARVLEKGYAYEKLQSVYFDISRFPGYGKLSGIDLNKIRLGSTVDLDEYEKANPRDFTLLKRAKLSELRRGIYTKTEWGNVRPSWHIESAAIAMKYLGDTFDLYTSSVDLMFPHHENEIAISGALSSTPLARCWILAEPALSGGKKAQTGPDTPYIRDLLDKGYGGRVIRYWLLSHNYRKPLQFSLEALTQSKASLQRLDECIQLLNELKGGRPFGDLDQLLYDARTGFTDAMDDDLDISSAMAAVFRAVRGINRLLSEGRLDVAGAKRSIDVFRGIDGVLGIFRFEQSAFDPSAKELMRQHNEAREKKDWARADEIRDRLRAMGTEVRDDKSRP